MKYYVIKRGNLKWPLKPFTVCPVIEIMKRSMLVRCIAAIRWSEF